MGGDIESQPYKNSDGKKDFSTALIERFLEPNEKDSHWLAAVELAQEIGYDFLTIAAVSKYNGAPLWARTTMDEAWVNLYLEKNYLSFDPMIAHMQTSNAHIVLDSEKRNLKKGENPQILEFLENARNLGYGRFRGIPFNWPTQTVYRIVTFGLNVSEKKTETPEMVMRAQILAEVLATRIAAPSDKISYGVMWPPKTVLSDRERELLYYLAIGLKNDRIAERCPIRLNCIRFSDYRS